MEWFKDVVLQSSFEMYDFHELASSCHTQLVRVLLTFFLSQHMQKCRKGRTFSVQRFTRKKKLDPCLMSIGQHGILWIVMLQQQKKSNKKAKLWKINVIAHCCEMFTAIHFKFSTLDIVCVTCLHTHLSWEKRKI